MIGKALVACEESQAVCIALRAQGWEAYSCDILPCSGGHPEWHMQGYLEDVIGDGTEWDMIIAFPPCTFLTVSNTYLKRGCSKYTAAQATEFTEYALNFICMILNRKCKLIGLENPVGRISTRIKLIDGIYTVVDKGNLPPSQIIQPNEFGEDASKKTCLWLKGLPLLKATSYIEPKIVNGKKIWANQTPSGQNKLGPSEDRSKLRSKTYPGIAKAMATQWTDFYIKEICGL